MKEIQTGQPTQYKISNVVSWSVVKDFKFLTLLSEISIGII